MPNASLPDDEPGRLHALARYAILGTPPEQVYTDTTALAAQVCGVPIALVSVVASDRVWFKSRVGIEATETPRDAAFCAHALLGDDVMVVPDATADPRFAENPLVVGPPHLRFYAGVPIVTPDGFRLGTLCVADTVARSLSAEQREALRALSRQVVANLEARRQLREQQELCRQLDEARTRLDLVVRGSCDGFWDWNVETNEVFYSPRCRELLGLPAGDLRDGPAAWRERLHPEDSGRVLKALAEHLKQRRPYYIEYRNRTPDGRYRWLRARGVATWDEKGKATRMAGSIADIDDRKAEATALQRVSELLEESQGIARVGGWELDLRTNQLFWTAETYRIHETSPELYSPTVDTAIAFYAPESVPIIRQAVERAIRDGAGFAHELELITAKGRRIWVYSSGRAEREGGAVTRIFGAFQDITDRKRADDDLRRAKEAAEAASRAKSEFLATMSHEIRTPMNGVLGFASLLRETQLTAEQRGHIDTIERCGRGLLTLIDDILDFSKIEAGRMTIESVPFDLRALSVEVLAMLDPLAKEKGVALTLDFTSPLPRRLVGDPNRIRQVLLNLAGNALKFTNHGSVRVAVAANGGGHFEVSVTDTGIGMSAEQQAQLFQQFVQADPSTRRRFGGTGLGLAISKRLVELMGGRIGMTSEPGVGSRFWFTLPARVPTPGAAPSVVDAPVAVANGGVADHGIPLRVLVAEDNPTNQRLAVHVLQRLGCTTEVAANGIEAVALAAQRGFDIILMDCLMPGMDGLEATRQIRRREAGEGARTPIVALTANAMPGDREACTAAGMDDYVTKPFSLQGLEQVVRRWTGTGRCRPDLQKPR